VSGSSLEKTISELFSPLAAEGYELWHTELLKEGTERRLWVYIEKEGGVGTDDCERVSRFLSDRLDEKDPIEGAYSLVVSSPGMDRTLWTDEQLARYIGKPVQVSLYKAFDGRKKFAALLGAAGKESLCLTPINAQTLAPEGAEIRVPRELVSKVNLLVVFD